MLEKELKKTKEELSKWKAAAQALKKAVGAKRRIRDKLMGEALALYPREKDKRA